MGMWGRLSAAGTRLELTASSSGLKRRRVGCSRASLNVSAPEVVLEVLERRDSWRDIFLGIGEGVTFVSKKYIGFENGDRFNRRPVGTEGINPDLV